MQATNRARTGGINTAAYYRLLVKRSKKKGIRTYQSEGIDAARRGGRHRARDAMGTRCERGDPVRACVRGDLLHACMRGDPLQACVRARGPIASVRAWGSRASVHAGTRRVRVHVCVGTWCVRACMGIRCVRAWDPVRVWGSSGHGTRVGTQRMKGAFGVQKVVSEDEVESLYYLPYKPSTGA